MSHGNPNPTDAWLLRNLRNQDASQNSSPLVSHTSGYRLSVLRIMLAVAAVSVAAVWYQESQLNLINAIDRIAYPLLVITAAVGALLLIVRPDTLRAVMNTVFVTLIAYLLTDYYYLLTYRGPDGNSSYAFATLALWLPLGYVSSYIFYSPKVAMRTSLGIYAAIVLPQFLQFGAEVNVIERQIAISMLISHPVYIAALWGVAQLKSHIRVVHDLAESVSLAATVDPLTGIANRRAMMHALEKVSDELTGHDRPVALLLFDVDRFKTINDRFGHAVGDDVLITLAQQTNLHLRASDLLGRWGGEEFMIIALDQTESQALQMAERLRVKLEQIIYPQVGRVTVSIGVTNFIHGEDVDDFVNRADKALYQAKERGRNRVEGEFINTVSEA